MTTPKPTNQIVYIILDKDNKPYTGCTSNIDDRMHRHNSGYVQATNSNLVQLMQ